MAKHPEKKVDLVIIGSGAAGLSCAVVAALSGLDVVVLESTRWFGGTSALSIGGVWIPMNHHMLAAGGTDSMVEAETYLRDVLGEYFDTAKIAAYLENAPKMLRYLEDYSEVHFELAPTPDYSAGRPGWKTGRTLVPLKFDGRRLGALADCVRPHIQEMGLFSSLQIPFSEYRRLMAWSTSLPNLKLTIATLLRYGGDRVLGRRGSQLANGNALIGRLLRSALDCEVGLVSEARVNRLLQSSGRVCGVEYGGPDGTRVVHAGRAVVIASGGFGANPEMRRLYMAQADTGWSLQPEGARGDGIRMGIEAGAVMRADNYQNGVLTAVSACRRKDGTLAVYPSMTPYPGTLKVDAATGRRFVDETLHYLHYGSVTRAKDIPAAWAIADAAAVKRFGLGMVKPSPFSVRPWVQRGYIIKGQSIAELAAKIGLEPTTLQNTIDRFNSDADRGADSEYGRGANLFSRYFADPAVKPNPTMRALTHPPFYALDIRPGEFSSVAGLDTDARGHVIDRLGKPIPGLYAAGIDANSIFRGHYPGAGSAIGPAMTFGYVIARGIAEGEPDAVPGTP